MTGYRTYITLACLFFVQLLNTFGFEEVTGEELNAAINVILIVAAWVFHKLHKPEE